MRLYILPILYALFLWWFSTGAILLVHRLPRAGQMMALLLIAALGAFACAGLWYLKDDTSVAGAYLSFTAAVIIWGLNEAAFLTGVITGPVRSNSPSDATGFQRFVHATGAILYHEAAILGGGVVIWAVAGDGVNQLGLLIYAVLAAMRISAKVNLFLGVPYPPSDMLPGHLAHIETCFRKRAMNALFPLSVTAGTCLALIFAMAAAAPGISDGGACGAAILAVLTALAVLEHWFLVLPLPSQALWGWSMKAPAETRQVPACPVLVNAAAPISSQRSPV